MMETPRGNRLHIGIFGRVNSGKSTLINALTGQQLSVVSDVPGTTTDPVRKAAELRGIGPCLFIDTPGFEDEGELGSLRLEKTKEAASQADIALLVVSAQEKPGADTPEMRWLRLFRQKGTPVILLLSKADLEAPLEWQARSWQKLTGLKPLLLSATGRQGMKELLAKIEELKPENYDLEDLTGSLAGPGDMVLLVMPQDIEAPKGRLILPQVQTIRHLLDKGCLISCCKTGDLEASLASLGEPPHLIITDSQAFRQVAGLCPPGTKMTSFSLLFAGVKGDLPYFVESARKLEKLEGKARILIAEACTHQPLHEDIGRVKIPRLLRQKLGEEVQIAMAAGKDFPSELGKYDLIIHCGGCMFNRKFMLSRVKAAKEQGVAMTNYGVAIAQLLGILSKVALPK